MWINLRFKIGQLGYQFLVFQFFVAALVPDWGLRLTRATLLGSCSFMTLRRAGACAEEQSRAASGENTQSINLISGFCRVRKVRSDDANIDLARNGHAM